jgi:mannose-6-phosphate isomerase-like protein (cupin superfamily)
MKIIKKPSETVKREEAHGGSGARRLYVSNNELENTNFQALTHGFLPAKSKFAWHLHEGIEEIMLVLKGEGIVRDHDGEYPYKIGDLFIYPQNVEHEIENTGNEEHEYIFIRTKV